MAQTHNARSNPRGLQRVRFILLLLPVAVLTLAGLRNVASSLSSPFGYCQQLDASFDITARQHSSLVHGSRTPRHVLLALSGNHSGFLGEFEVALKSILLHAPLDDPLTVHIIADAPAYNALPDIIVSKANLSHWTTRTLLKITIYNVQSRQEEWLRRIESRMALAANLTTHSLYRHTIGAYFRLFAGEVLPLTVETVVYLDTDTVLLSSLDGIWKHHLLNETVSISTTSGYEGHQYSYYWGKERCSAFMILRPHQMERVWELYGRVPVETLRKLLGSRPVADDQFVLTAVQREFPEVVGALREEWDISAQDGPWKRNPHELLLHRPQAGMLHFNGGGESKQAYFESHKFFLNGDPNNLWGLAKYYVDLPWSWAQFMVESQATEGHGYAVEVTFKDD
jgi:hypothetical protein